MDETYRYFFRYISILFFSIIFSRIFRYFSMYVSGKEALWPLKNTEFNWKMVISSCQFLFLAIPLLDKLVGIRSL